jgi:hypothetical protein
MMLIPICGAEPAIASSLVEEVARTLDWKTEAWVLTVAVDKSGSIVDEELSMIKPCLNTSS